MRIQDRMKTAAVLLGVGCVLFSCGSDAILNIVDGEWVSDIPFVIGHVNQEIAHDNRIFESDHFLVFSDASSDRVKKRFASFAEQALDELMDDFGIRRAADLGIVNQSSKLTIYTNKATALAQMAFPYGFILWGEDSDNFAGWPMEMQDRFHREIKHETTHVLQFLLGVLPNKNNALEPDKWFNEGLAEYASGGFFIPIKTKESMNIWKRQHQEVVPVSIHQWSDLPISADEVGGYYPMFGLAVRYLLSKKGMGRSLKDVKNMFLDMAENHRLFSEAFHLHMGLSLADYEATFWPRMEAFWD